MIKIKNQIKKLWIAFVVAIILGSAGIFCSVVFGITNGFSDLLFGLVIVFLVVFLMIVYIFLSVLKYKQWEYGIKKSVWEQEQKMKEYDEVISQNVSQNSIDGFFEFSEGNHFFACKVFDFKPYIKYTDKQIDERHAELENQVIEGAQDTNFDDDMEIVDLAWTHFLDFPEEIEEYISNNNKENIKIGYEIFLRK